MQITRQIVFDIDKNIYTTIDTKQNDINSRFIEFTLVNNSLPMDLTGHTVKIFAVKADNTLIFNNVTIANATEGKVLVELTSQALAVSGTLRCELVIYGNDSSVLSTKSFKISVIASIRDDSAVESTNEFTALTEALSTVTRINNKADKMYVDEEVNSVKTELANKANKIEVENSIKIINTQLAEQTTQINDIETEYAKTVDVNNALELKRDKSVKITTNDIDKTSDATKIHLLDLAEEVQQAMAGMAPVISSVPDGSLTREKLADVFSLGNDLANGTDLNTVTSEGNFSGVGNGGYLNLPPSFPTTRSFVLNVTPIFKGNNRFKIQTLIDYIDPYKQYVRRLDTLTPASSSAWTMNGSYNAPSSITETEIANNSISNAKYKAKSIDNSKLFDNILTKPNLTTGTDLNTLLIEGRYLGLGTDTFLNIHDSFIGKSFLLDIKTYGTSGGFYIQQMTEYFKPEHQMVRFVQKTASTTVTPWVNVINQSSSSRLAGKTIVCFGDSITEGTASNKYPDLIAQYLGATVINVGFGGCQMAKHMNTQAGNWYDEMGMYKLANAIATNNFTALESAAINLRDTYGDDNTAIVARLKAINWNTVDYAIIKYGQNDYASNIVPIGTNADADGTTFKGAINYSIEKLLTAYPHLKIAFITPYWRARLLSGDGKESDTNPNTNGNYLIEYVDAIKERANAHHLPVLDLYREGGINKYNGTIYQTDGLHPTPAGYELIAKKISAFLEAKF